MKIRKIDDHKITGDSSMFNTAGLGEIIVFYDDEDGGCDSEYTREWEVYITSVGKWMPIREAFKEKLLISDNYDKYFREPINEEEKNRGWY